MFNFQGSDLISSLLLSNSFIISPLFEFVKYFFKISFDFFRLVSFSLFWDATFILYHTLLHLSSTFSKFLLIFSWPLLSCMIYFFVCFLFTWALHFSFSVRSLEYLSVRLAFGYSFVSPRESALLLYAFRLLLSTLFWHFFWVC